MLHDSVMKTSFELFFLCESFKENKPCLESLRLVLKRHFLLLIVNDFNNTAHDIGEEHHSTKHITDSQEYLGIANRIVVSISYSCKSSH
jgi:deoxyadenosine/deoxycytidine kinase